MMWRGKLKMEVCVSPLKGVIENLERGKERLQK